MKNKTVTAASIAELMLTALFIALQVPIFRTLFGDANPWDRFLRQQADDLQRLGLISTSVVFGLLILQAVTLHQARRGVVSIEKDSLLTTLLTVINAVEWTLFALDAWRPWAAVLAVALVPMALLMAVPIFKALRRQKREYATTVSPEGAETASELAKS